MKRHALRQLQRLGYDVTLTPLAATAQREVPATRGIFASGGFGIPDTLATITARLRAPGDPKQLTQKEAS